MILNYFLDPPLDDILPKSAWLELTKRGKGPDKGYNRCYAKKQADINTFHVLCPWDIHFKFAIGKSMEKGMYAFDEYTKNLIKVMAIRYQEADQVEYNNPVVQISLPFTFYTKKTCYLEMRHSYYSPKHCRTIEAKFDISSWVRPINWSFEIDAFDREIKIKRGDVLCEVAFHKDKVQNITLKENDDPDPRLVKLSKNNPISPGFIKGVARLLPHGKKLLQKLVR